MLKCKNCDNDLIKREQKKFCSRSCATSYNNRQFPKRLKEGRCKTCKAPISSKLSYCSSCWSDLSISPEDYMFKTLGEVLTKDTQKYRKVRTHARIIASRHNKLNSCLNCNYSVHVETCHIKAIKYFPNNTLLSEINSPTNLVGLCRNCHWEFDHGLLSISV